MNNIEVLTQENKKESLATFNNTESLSSLVTKAFAMQELCEDHNVNGKKLRIDNDLNLTFDDGKYAYEYPMSQHSFSQLCTKAEVPVRYMKTCLKKGKPQLVTNNLNEWLKDLDKNMFVRTYDDQVRGVLSDKYSVMDTPDILKSLNDVTEDDFKVKSYFMNEERLHVRMIGQPMNIPNEDLFTGIQIDSSDVGRNLLVVKFFIYKQVCTNGLVVSKGGSTLFEQKHIGIRKDKFIRGFRSNIDILPDLVARAEENIIDAMEQRIGNTKSFQHLVEKIVSDLRLAENTDQKIINLLPRYGHTKWGLVNTLTELAQDYTLERRLDIEKYAGQLLVA